MQFLLVHFVSIFIGAPPMCLLSYECVIVGRGMTTTCCWFFPSALTDELSLEMCAICLNVQQREGYF